jgi:hypothetical protein
MTTVIASFRHRGIPRSDARRFVARRHLCGHSRARVSANLESRSYYIEIPGLALTRHPAMTMPMSAGMTGHDGTHLDAIRPWPYELSPMINASTILVARRRRAIAVRAADRV